MSVVAKRFRRAQAKEIVDAQVAFSLLRSIQVKMGAPMEEAIGFIKDGKVDSVSFDIEECGLHVFMHQRRSGNMIVRVRTRSDTLELTFPLAIATGLHREELDLSSYR